MAPAPPVSSIRQLMRQYGPETELYVYAADEVTRCTALFPALKAWARNTHEAGALCLATVAPVAELQDDGRGAGRSAIDIWVLLPKMFGPFEGEIKKVLAKGDRVWSYNALVQDAYSPKWLIDFAPVNLRIHPGFLSQSLGLTGILYWSINNWTRDPWNDVESYREGSQVFPGEGVLVYPGAPLGIAGVVPSMRLKWLRDGVEDFEYVALLKQAGRGEWALHLIRSVAGSWSDWTHEPVRIEAVRQQLGAELDRLGGSLRSVKP